MASDPIPGRFSVPGGSTTVSAPAALTSANAKAKGPTGSGSRKGRRMGVSWVGDDRVGLAAEVAVDGQVRNLVAGKLNVWPTNVEPADFPKVGFLSGVIS